MKLDLITNTANLEGDINPNDEFYTPNYAIEPLIKYLKPNSNIWCPFDTEESNFVKCLKELGHRVICTHIFNGDDFFYTEAPEGTNYIISNPPYSIKFQVINRLFKLKIPCSIFTFLSRISFLI
jgi:hypothetical protein